MDWSRGRSTFNEAMRRQASWMRRSIRDHEIKTVIFVVFMALVTMLAIVYMRDNLSHIDEEKTCCCWRSLFFLT